jgi:uncharacterized protein (TIGR02466 family)
MDHKVHSLFPKPLYSSKIKIQEELSVAKGLKYNNKDDYGLRVTTDKNILDLNEFSEIKSQIETHINIYVRDVLCINEQQSFHICRSWGVKVESGVSANSHSHPNSVISGVFYLQYPEGSGGITLLRNGFNKLFPQTIQFKYDHFNKYNSDTWTFIPEVGTLFLFPSQERHKVERNRSDDDRYSIAFDCWVSGTFGAEGTVTYLNL